MAGRTAIGKRDAADLALQFRPNGNLGCAVHVLGRVFRFRHGSVSLRGQLHHVRLRRHCHVQAMAHAGRIEAANGILMFVVSTSVMTAAVMDVTKYHHARLQQE